MKDGSLVLAQQSPITNGVVIHLRVLDSTKNRDYELIESIYNFDQIKEEILDWLIYENASTEIKELEREYHIKYRGRNIVASCSKGNDKVTYIRWSMFSKDCVTGYTQVVTIPVEDTRMIRAYITDIVRNDEFDIHPFW